MDQNQEALPNRQVGDRTGNDLLESGSSSNKPRSPVQVRIIELSKIEGDHVLWTVTLAGVDEPITVTVTNGTLVTFKRFRDLVLRERGVMLERLTSGEWWRMVDPAMYVFLNGGRS
jgi:hypothetical protein